MTRQSLNASAATALTAETVYTGYLVRIVFPSVVVYATTMGVTIPFNGNDYVPHSELISWGGLTESTDLKARGVDFNLFATPALKAAALNDNWHLSPVDIWLVVCDSAYQVIGQPAQVARNLRMAFISLEDGDNAKLTLTCETGAVDAVRDSLQIVSGETQRARYPGDTAFDRLPQIVSKVIDWGGKTTTPGTDTRPPMPFIPGRSGIAPGTGTNTNVGRNYGVPANAPVINNEPGGAFGVTAPGRSGVRP